MDCQEFRNLVSSILDGDIDASKSAATRAHLEGCTDCNGLVADLRHILRKLRSLTRLRVSENFQNRLAARIVGDGGGFVSRLRRFHMVAPPTGLRWYGAAAAVVLLLVGMSYFARQASGPSRTGLAPLSTQTVRHEAQSEQPANGGAAAASTTDEAEPPDVADDENGATSDESKKTVRDDRLRDRIRIVSHK